MLGKMKSKLNFVVVANGEHQIQVCCKAMEISKILKSELEKNQAQEDQSAGNKKPRWGTFKVRD